MNNKNMPYAKNIQSINFDNRTERKGKPHFKKSVINCVGLTLSNKLLKGFWLFVYTKSSIKNRLFSWC